MGSDLHSIGSPDPIERSVRTVDVGVIVEALRPEQLDVLVGRLCEVIGSHRLECARQPQGSMARSALAEKVLRLEATLTAIFLAVADQPTEPF